MRRCEPRRPTLTLSADAAHAHTPATVLGRAYHNVLRQFLDENARRLAGERIETLRLLPISGGIFAGEYQDEIAPLTFHALSQVHSDALGALPRRAPPRVLLPARSAWRLGAWPVCGRRVVLTVCRRLEVARSPVAGIPQAADGGPAAALRWRGKAGAVCQE